MKTAVVLFNLGGPDNQQAVKPFLFNLFNDPAIIRLPLPLRFLIAKLISGKREKTAQEIYQQMGGGSPILPNTQAQADALNAALGNDYKIFIAMRYWHPFTTQTMRDVKNYAPDKIILLPLYPQFSTTTTASSLKEWHQQSAKVGLNAPTKTICCYPHESGFIKALAASTRGSYAQAAHHGTPRVLFSAHGLPEKIVKAGDPYAWQCERTVQALVQEIGIDGLDYVLCYQSRVGPMKWIGPSTDDEVRAASARKQPIVVVPVAFVSEHSETLVEIDKEYRHLAHESGAPFYAYVPTVSTAPDFIQGLASLVRKAQDSRAVCASGSGAKICPAGFKGCCQQ